MKIHRHEVAGEPVTITPEDLGIPWAARIIEYEETGCWLWIGAVSNKGYGSVHYQKVKQPTHRATYKFCVGDIPANYVVDHLCRIPSCVNPAHLEPVPQSENVRRGDLPAVTRDRFRARTHCRNGHPIFPGSCFLINRPTGVFNRCRECRKAGWHRAEERRRASSA